MYELSENQKVARKRYLKHTQDALDLLLTISNEIESQRNDQAMLIPPRDVDWGDVGTAEHIKNRVQDIHDQIMCEGEYGL